MPLVVILMMMLHLEGGGIRDVFCFLSLELHFTLFAFFWDLVHLHKKIFFLIFFFVFGWVNIYLFLLLRFPYLFEDQKVVVFFYKVIIFSNIFVVLIRKWYASVQVAPDDVVLVFERTE